MNVIEIWRRQFGNIFQIHLVGKCVIVVSGENELREMIVTKPNDFAGRPYMFRWQQLISGEQQISGGDYCPKWIMMKKAFIKTMKMYGERLSSLEAITQNAVQSLVERFDKTDGQPINIKNDVHRTVTDIMAYIVWLG